MHHGKPFVQNQECTHEINAYGTRHMYVRIFRQAVCIVILETEARLDWINKYAPLSAVCIDNLLTKRGSAACNLLIPSCPHVYSNIRMFTCLFENIFSLWGSLMRMVCTYCNLLLYCLSFYMHKWWYCTYWNVILPILVHVPLTRVSWDGGVTG